MMAVARGSHQRALEALLEPLEDVGRELDVVQHNPVSVLHCRIDHRLGVLVHALAERKHVV
jgi:hypothetical protein